MLEIIHYPGDDINNNYIGGWKLLAWLAEGKVGLTLRIYLVGQFVDINVPGIHFSRGFVTSDSVVVGCHAILLYTKVSCIN